MRRSASSACTDASGMFSNSKVTTSLRAPSSPIARSRRRRASCFRRQPDRPGVRQRLERDDAVAHAFCLERQHAAELPAAEDADRPGHSVDDSTSAAIFATRASSFAASAASPSARMRAA